MPVDTSENYFSEIEGLLDQLNLDLRALCASGQSSAEPEAINRCFRTAHSLKGIAGLDGRAPLSDLAHCLEELLNGLRLGRVPLSSEVQSTLLDGMSHLAALFQYPEAPEALESLSTFQKNVQQLQQSTSIDRAHQLLEQKLPESLLGQLSEYEEHRLCLAIEQNKRLILIQGCFPFARLDEDLHATMDSVSTFAEVIGTLPWEDGAVAEGLGLQLLVASDKTSDELQEELSLPIGKMQYVSVLADESGESIPVNAGMASRDLDIRSQSPSIRIDIGQLDQLVHAVGELYLVRADLEQWLEALPLPRGSQQRQEGLRLARRLDKNLDSLRRTSMELRTVPVRQLLDRLWRIVRQTGDALGKQVRFKLEGEDTRIDKFLMEELANPLMHLVRNAVDHGLESPAERQKAGKDPVGNVAVKVRRVGQQLSIDVSDDGRGADLNGLLAQARKRGLVPSREEMSSDEILELAFAPGMSSREKADAFSGRGVGLDVVRDQISRMAGRVQAHSQPGQGMQVQISLPATLSLTTILLVEAGGGQCAVPVSAVRETLTDKTAVIDSETEEQTLQLRGEKVPCLNLNDFFDESTDSEILSGYYLILGLGDQVVAVHVDRILGQQEAMVRPLGPLLEDIRGVAGVAVIGNERLALLIDVGVLVSDACGRDS